MQNRYVCSVLAVSWLTCIPVSAGEDPDISLGDKLRIRLAQGNVVGTLAALDENTLTLKDLTTAEITAHSLDTVRAVEVSRGRHSRGRNAGKGALIGGAVGATLGVAGTSLCDQSEEGCGGGWVLIGGAAFGATGALLGALIGAVISPGEAWRPVNLKGIHASVTPVRGGAQFRVTVAF